MIFNLLKHTEDCRKLLLIYSGWSTDASFYQHISKTGWDVGVVSDYSDLLLDTKFLDNYDTVWLFAWSLGVKMAAISLPADKITAAFAINGTLNPVSDKEGIPTNIFYGTAENLNQRNLSKFQLRMSGSKEIFNNRFTIEYSDADIERLKNELYVIAECGTPANNLPWRKAYVSTEDKIFPFENMMYSWENRDVEVATLSQPHYIDLQSIIDMAVPNLSVIANRFSESVDSYVENAKAQKQITDKLASLLDDYLKYEGGNLLEIGPGKGLFTRKYADIICPDKADFVDLTMLEPFFIAKDEHYFKQDAEDFIENAGDGDYDFIVSSSAVQWFVNFPKFVENSARLLAHNGVLCFSTFRKGNLEELDEFRPSPLNYYTAIEISNIVSEYFEDVEVYEDIVKLEFNTPRELLMHLKLTGVGGFAPSTGLSPLKLRNTTSLTFRPVYVLARKK